MKLTVLVENTSCSEELIAQHGLSLYLETENCCVLFDMGQDATFARNAEKLGVDLSKVDLAILSHGHYDHGGGLAEFLRINETAPVYIHEKAFGPYYNGTEKYIGLDLSLQHHPRLRLVNGSLDLPFGMHLMDCNDLGWRYDSWGLTCKNQEGFFPDPFFHEHYLEITEGEKKYLISGCSHKGIINIADHFQPDVLIGGFHLNKQEDEQVLAQIAEDLLCKPAVYYTGHCTGSKQYAYLKEKMGNRLQSLSTGMVIKV